MGLFDSGVPYQRMLNVSGGFQRYRMMRYVMVLGIILVTIFLYVSYYTTSMDSVDNRYVGTFASSLEQRQQPQLQTGVLNTSDENFFVIGPEVPSNGNTSGAGAAAAAGGGSGVRTEEEVAVPSEPAPKEGGSGSSSSNSNSRGTEAVDNNKTNIGAGGGGGVPTKEQSEEKKRPETELLKNIKKDLLPADLEQKALANRSIIIPRVVNPRKDSILAQLNNSTKAAITAAWKTSSKNKLTGEVYEPGFMDPNPDLCPNNGSNIRLLALVHSAPNHIEARDAIRQTWKHYGTRRDISIGFLVGRTSNATWDANLISEQFMYSDIVRGNSYDSYDNLTLKTISMLEWADTYCGQARFLLKVDDDMFINVPKLLEFITRHWNETRHIYGRLAKKWRPIRNKKSKYYVSPLLYAPKNFPDFVTGPSYLLTTDILREMYEASLTHAFLKLEDVYMTGIVSEMVGVKRKHVNEFLNRRIAFNPCAIRRAISIHMVKGKEQFELWKKLLDVDLKCK